MFGLTLHTVAPLLLQWLGWDLYWILFDEDGNEGYCGDIIEDVNGVRGSLGDFAGLNLCSSCRCSVARHKI
jgi:hypothetical protein